MKVLKFIVNENTLETDFGNNSTGLYPGIKETILIEFSFSPEWKNRVKVAAFWSVTGREYPPQHLTDGRSCLVPPEALQGATFKVQILGKSNGEKFVTNKCSVRLKGGRP